MESAIDLTFLRLGTVLKTVTLVQSALHPDISDISWDTVLGWLKDIAQGFADAYGGKWGDLGNDSVNFLKDLTKGENVQKGVSGKAVWWQGGEVDPSTILADEVRILYRAWSDDSLTSAHDVKITPVPPTAPPVQDLGVTLLNDNNYHRAFQLRLDNRGPGGLLIAAGAGDSGWHFSAAILTALSIVLSPAIKQLRHSGFLLQSNFGATGNFELIVPAPNGGLAYYWRDNDDALLPWYGPLVFRSDLGQVGGVSMIQSTVTHGTGGLGDLIAVVQSNGQLQYLQRSDQSPLPWFAPTVIATGVRGSPALIQSAFGLPNGNLEVVVPDATAGMRHYFRLDDPDGPIWKGPTLFGQQLGLVDAVAFCQATLGTPGLGNFELVARVGSELFFFERDDQAHAWSQGLKIADGVAGEPSIIQSRFGNNGNFEVVVPNAQGGLLYLWRNNNTEERPWSAPIPFAQDLGKLDRASLIQSTFNVDQIGNLELAVQAGPQITMLWRPDIPNAQWQPPQTLKPTPFDLQVLAASANLTLEVRRSDLGSALVAPILPPS
jgi:hypothetical protein